MTDSLPIFRRTVEGFIPANEAAQGFFYKTKLGELVTLTGKKPRGLKYHRLFFAILKLISENSQPPISPGAALHFAKIAAGVGEVVTDSRGETHFVPGSISFAKMDQAGFEAFVQSAIPPLVGRFMRGSAPDDVIAEAMELASA